MPCLYQKLKNKKKRSRALGFG
ncbi:hypothetical protein F383_23777 [Gossypium arboreum]|uniref:Uncharacterized protein n=1 Tax=Gossypium arboreum TaxID=29729 RepID=A0A0B0NZC5_GOSAR|nr:hypothetical protein F383_23777 [Gossypium arboreum]